MESLTISDPPSSLLLAGSVLQADLPEAYSSPGRIACHCYGASESEVRKIVIEESLSSVSELTELTGFGGACRACGNCLKSILAEQQRPADNSVYSEPLDGNPRSKPALLGHHSRE